MSQWLGDRVSTSNVKGPRVDPAPGSSPMHTLYSYTIIICCSCSINHLLYLQHLLDIANGVIIGIHYYCAQALFLSGAPLFCYT